MQGNIPVPWILWDLEKAPVVVMSPWVFDQRKIFPGWWLRSKMETSKRPWAHTPRHQLQLKSLKSQRSLAASWQEGLFQNGRCSPFWGGGWLGELCCIFWNVTWKSQKIIAKESVFRWFWARLKSRLTWWRVVKNLNASQMLWNLKYLWT